MKAAILPSQGRLSVTCAAHRIIFEKLLERSSPPQKIPFLSCQFPARIFRTSLSVTRTITGGNLGLIVVQRILIRRTFEFDFRNLFEKEFCIGISWGIKGSDDGFFDPSLYASSKERSQVNSIPQSSPSLTKSFQVKPSLLAIGDIAVAQVALTPLLKLVS
ncbi:hypothetical protein CEXT_741911 [Caerostris extrusa]|uniref:Uncharacterized protein n=1 Tax=Caerostris extrusa TaxID=172846 RepID=A0AAV4VF41_CAEEX|nr:hypothetical protein CEXT_741911 [Caerostris extrusa]